MIINATSIHDKLYKRISNQKIHAIVHSNFEHAINLLLDNKMITLLTKNSDLVPYSIILNIDNFTSYNIKVNEIIQINNNEILFDCFKIDLSNSKKFSLSNFGCIKYSNYIIEQNNNYVEKVLNECLKNKDLIVYYEIEKKIESIISFAKEFNRIDIDLIKKLIGLGIGLTPSGDDILVGMLSVILKIKDVNNKYESILRIELEKLLDTHTNLISKNMIINAFDGYFKSSINDIVYKYQSSIISFSDLESLIYYGHSSGIDTLQGIYLGYKIAKHII